MLAVSGILLGEFNPLDEVVARELFSFRVFGQKIVFSNHMLMVLLACIILMVLLPISVRGKGLVRRGLGNLMETICVFLREDVARPFLGDSTDKHIGFVWTIFFFVLTLNLLGMIPINKVITLVSGRPSYIGGPATANIWIVGSMAIVSFIAIHVSGIREQGLWHYIKNFAPRVPWPMVPLIYFMEIVGALVKPFSLAIRLFANIFAGHVLVATLMIFTVIFKNMVASAAATFLSILMIVAVSFLELLVAFLQAYIFTFLSTIFIGFAVNPQH